MGAKGCWLRVGRRGRGNERLGCGGKEWYMMMRVERAGHRGRERVNNQSHASLIQWVFPLDILCRDFVWKARWCGWNSLDNKKQAAFHKIYFLGIGLLHGRHLTRHGRKSKRFIWLSGAQFCDIRTLKLKQPNGIYPSFILLTCQYSMQ